MSRDTFALSRGQGEMGVMDDLPEINIFLSAFGDVLFNNAAVRLHPSGGIQLSGGGKVEFKKWRPGIMIPFYSFQRYPTIKKVHL